MKNAQGTEWKMGAVGVGERRRKTEQRRRNKRSRHLIKDNRTGGREE